MSTKSGRRMTASSDSTLATCKVPTRLSCSSSLHPHSYSGGQVLVMIHYTDGETEAQAVKKPAQRYTARRGHTGMQTPIVWLQSPGLNLHCAGEMVP